MKRYRLFKVVLAGVFLALFLSGSAWSYSITLGYDSLWSTYLTSSSTYDGPTVVTAGTEEEARVDAVYTTLDMMAVSRELNEDIIEGSSDFIGGDNGATNDGPAPVPEPSTLILLGVGLVGAAMLRKKMA